jgi:uncharacterized protein YqjF (DUF2071 family)
LNPPPTAHLDNSSEIPASAFLSAEWHYLAILNYGVDAKILAPFVPTGTELDFWNNKTLVSVVGFLFQNTRIRGIAVPFHRNFEEVNLRFYVRRKTADGWRRAVVFIKEIVPRLAIAATARRFYNENYIALPMSHQIEKISGEIKSAAYFWRFNGRENSLSLTTRSNVRSVPQGSEAEFITEHYWGYSAQKDGTTLEYQVEHPRWRIWETQDARLDCDVAKLYGEEFSEALSHPPASAFLVEGSAVKVFSPARL